MTESREVPKFINYANNGFLASCYNLLYMPDNTAAHLTRNSFK